MKPVIPAAIAASIAALGPNIANASCGSAFCFVNTNWSLQGIWTQPGPHFDLRYEYIDQDQPMAGSNKVSVGQIPAHHDEVSTINQNVIGTFDYGFSPNWGMTLVVPIVSRDHEHIHNHRGEQLLEQWNFTQLGDIRVQGRWQTAFRLRPAADRAGFAGATFGLTLPTGKTDVTNGEGEVAERSLQPGTGTTQLALTAYYREALPIHNSSWYAQAAAQLPLNTHDNYKPGNQFGVRSRLPLRCQRPARTEPSAQLRLQGPRQGFRSRAGGFRRPDAGARPGHHLRVLPGGPGVRDSCSCRSTDTSMACS